MRKHLMTSGFIRLSPAKATGLISRQTLLVLGVSAALGFASCNSSRPAVEASAPGVTVGVTKILRRNLKREITLSSELVPFQEIDVYAKEAGYVKNLYVDYGSRVKCIDCPAARLYRVASRRRGKHVTDRDAESQRPLHRRFAPVPLPRKQGRKLWLCRNDSF